MSTIAKEIASRLLQIKAIQLRPQNPFTWASGIQSPIYCDNRITLSYPEIRNLIRQGFIALSRDFAPFDIVAGVATAGIPHGILLADSLGLPFVYVRDKAKGHGRQNQIEGLIHGGEKVLLVEDLISTGGSSLLAVQAIRDAGCEVKGVIAIFSYGFQKAAEAFHHAQCPLATLTDYNTLIEEAIQLDYIDAESLNTLREWRTNPEKWNGYRVS